MGLAARRLENAMTYRKRVASFVAAGLLLAVSGRAEAAKFIFTPPLQPLPSGSLMCDVVNTVDAPITFEIDIVSTLGVVVNTVQGGTQYPSGNPLSTLAISTNDLARFCRVAIASGNPKNLRVSLQSRDSGGVVLGVVEGH